MFHYASTLVLMHMCLLKGPRLYNQKSSTDLLDYKKIGKKKTCRPMLQEQHIYATLNILPEVKCVKNNAQKVCKHRNG